VPLIFTPASRAVSLAVVNCATEIRYDALPSADQRRTARKMLPLLFTLSPVITGKCHRSVKFVCSQKNKDTS